MSKKILIYLIIFLIGMFIWSYFASESNKLRLMISSPYEILEYSYSNMERLLEDIKFTLLESVFGLCLGVFFGLITMLICIYFPGFRTFIMPAIVVSQVIPLITLAPLFILLFGIGIISKVVMSALICFFPVFISFNTGVKLVDKNIQEFFFTHNSSVHQKVINMYFPLSVPHIMSGVKVASTLSVIGALVGEFNGAEHGLGRNLFLAAKRLEPELMMSSLFLSSFLGGLLYLVIVFIEKRIGKWYLN